MNSNKHLKSAGPLRFAPDGVDEATAEQLIAQVDQEIERRATEAPEPTSALLDGSAVARRRRRIERRELSAVVRSLPVRRPRPAGEVA